MHTHGHWKSVDASGEAVLAWNAVSRDVMAGKDPTPNAARIRSLAHRVGAEDAEVGDEGDFRQAVAQSRTNLLLLVDQVHATEREGRDGPEHAAARARVKALCEEALSAYDRAMDGEPALSPGMR